MGLADCSGRGAGHCWFLLVFRSHCRPVRIEHSGGCPVGLRRHCNDCAGLSFSQILEITLRLDAAMKITAADTGRGLRGVHATGVLTRCTENAIHFDTGAGVSAGSASVASYLAGQRGRNCSNTVCIIPVFPNKIKIAARISGKLLQKSK